ncbi:MAG TPA: bile acid:sodium symporter [Pirellulales bacterium]|nr:bile acid:sodium symporter [Pirellulales bacterium]
MDLATISRLLNVAALIVVMLSLGLSLEPMAIVAAIRRVHLTAAAMAVNLIVVPSITLLLLRLIPPPDDAAIGFLVLALCAGAPVGPLFTGIAKGDIELATGLMVVLAASSTFLVPALLPFFTSWVAEGMSATVDYRIIAVVLLVTQLLPHCRRRRPFASNWSAASATHCRADYGLALGVAPRLTFRFREPILRAG